MSSRLTMLTFKRIPIYLGLLAASLNAHAKPMAPIPGTHRLSEILGEASSGSHHPPSAPSLGTSERMATSLPTSSGQASHPLPSISDASHPSLDENLYRAMQLPGFRRLREDKKQAWLAEVRATASTRRPGELPPLPNSAGLFKPLPAVGELTAVEASRSAQRGQYLRRRLRQMGYDVPPLKRGRRFVEIPTEGTLDGRQMRILAQRQSRERVRARKKEQERLKAEATGTEGSEALLVLAKAASSAPTRGSGERLSAPAFEGMTTKARSSSTRRPRKQPSVEPSLSKVAAPAAKKPKFEWDLNHPPPGHDSA